MTKCREEVEHVQTKLVKLPVLLQLSINYLLGSLYSEIVSMAC